MGSIYKLPKWRVTAILKHATINNRVNVVYDNYTKAIQLYAGLKRRGYSNVKLKEE